MFLLVRYSILDHQEFDIILLRLELCQSVFILDSIQLDKEAIDKQVKAEIEYRLKQEKAKEQFGM